MRIAPTLLALLLAPLPSLAAPPTDESLLRLFASMKAEALIDSAYAVMDTAMRQSLSQVTAGRTLTPEQARVIELAPQRLATLLRTELSWDKLRPLQMAVYRESFDQAEVDGLIAFYESPVGRSFAAKMPLVTQRSAAAMHLVVLSRQVSTTVGMGTSNRCAHFRIVQGQCRERRSCTTERTA